MQKYTNSHGKECWKDVTPEDLFSEDMFHVVPEPKDNYDEDYQVALHTNLGSITVLDRMTGFGYRDVETGYRSPDNKFWLASGHCDVRFSGAKTFGEAIEWIKANANNCVGI